MENLRTPSDNRLPVRYGIEQVRLQIRYRIDIYVKTSAVSGMGMRENYGIRAGFAREL